MTVRSIRSLRADDIAALEAIDKAAHGERWSRRTYLDEIERSDRVHLVAVIGDRVVGHAGAWIDENSCRITNVAVNPDDVGNGHATALLIALIDAVLAEHRVTNMQLEVRPGNRRAQRMYGRFGFVPAGIQRDFYDRSDALGSRDAVVMAVSDVFADDWRGRIASIGRVEFRPNHASTPDTDAGTAA